MVHLQLKIVVVVPVLVVVVLVVIRLEDKAVAIPLVDLHLHPAVAAEQGILTPETLASSLLNLHDPKTNVNDHTVRPHLKEVVDWRKCYSEVDKAHIIMEVSVIVDHMFQKDAAPCRVH